MNKIILVAFLNILMCVTFAQANNVQDSIAKLERTINRGYAQINKNRQRAEVSRSRTMSRAYNEAHRSQRRMDRNINRILNNSEIKSNKKHKYRKRKYRRDNRCFNFNKRPRYKSNKRPRYKTRKYF